MLPAWFLANARPLLVLGLVLVLGGWGLWERGNAADARAELAEFRAAYLLLAEKVKDQNAAVEAWQKTANAAARNAATARATAAEASRRAEQLAGRLAGLQGPPSQASAEEQLESIALLLREARR